MKKRLSMRQGKERRMMTLELNPRSKNLITAHQKVRDLLSLGEMWMKHDGFLVHSFTGPVC